MKRRDFLKSTAATGAALITIGGLYALNRSRASHQTHSSFGFQSARLIPVSYNVDVVIAGGSAAAVAAAVAAARNGASVFLAAPETYLGEDLCGTYRIWEENESATRTSLGKKIFGTGLPTPLHIKKTLDNELINNKISFLYSSYVTDIISDEAGGIAGVVIANRSGRQAIKAKVIIDATPRGLVARQAGCRFTDYPAGKQEFKYIVVGNQSRDIPGAQVRTLSQPVIYGGKTHWALEYTMQLEMNDGSWKSFCRAEQEARDLTWDPAQVESSDNLFQVPPDQVICKQRWNSAVPDNESVSLTVFQPRQTERFFMLSGIADIDRRAAELWLEPGMMIRLGERIGENAATLAARTPEPRHYIIKEKSASQVVPGDVGEILDGLRPSLNLGKLKAEPTSLPILGNYDVVILGGGVAGAPAGIGAARNGASTLVLEYLHGLGGTGTLAMIGTYFHGYRAGFTAEVDKEVRAIGAGNPRMDEHRPGQWVMDWKTEYFRKEIRKAGGEIWYGIIGVGAYVNDGTVKGVVVATPEGRGVVLANTVIDSTGSADVAIAAGADYTYTGADTVAVQGAGVPPKNPGDWYNNTDWTFIDDSDMLDIWRAFVIARDKFHFAYDTGKLPQTRERRRVVGDYTVSVLDIWNNRTFPDTFSIHVSRFDSHGYSEDPFFLIKPPSIREEYTAHVPFRALLPKGLEGIAVLGLGASAHRDAMPVIRMQPCLQNQGYSMGLAAALAAKNKQKIRQIDLKFVQRKLVELNNLPENVLTFKDNFPQSIDQIRYSLKTVLNDLDGLELLIWDTDRSIPLIEEAFHQSNNSEHRLVYARILGILGLPTGWEVLRLAVDAYEEWDGGWDYRGMHQFGECLSHLDSLILALGRTKKTEATSSIIRLARKLTPEHKFSNFHYVAIALETINNPEAATVLYQLLQMPGVSGHAMTDIHLVKKLTPIPRGQISHYGEDSTRINSLRELILARALFRVGDFNGQGKKILDKYSNDLRGHYYRHASGVLEKYSKPG
jgi:hypothetical protein